MPEPIILVVYALAVARLTRLVTVDKLTLPPRRALVKWAFRRANKWVKNDEDLALAMSAHVDDPPMLAYLANCPWCVSIWLGLATAPLIWFWGASPWLLIPALALAISYAVGFLASKEG